MKEILKKGNLSLLVHLFSILVVLACLQCKKKNDTVPNPPNPAQDYQLPGENNNGAGTSAKDFLRADKPQLLVEINYMKGYALSSSSVSNLTTFLQKHLNKPGGIKVVQSEIPAGASNPISLEEIKRLEKRVRKFYATPSYAVIHFLITNSNYTNPNVLGIAYLNTSLCLFGKTIHENSGGLNQASRVKVESAVLNHEVGHLLGLTNIGTPMVSNHSDPSHQSHCNNNQCLMYYATETTDMLGILFTGNIPELDQNCIDDLRANGGK